MYDACACDGDPATFYNKCTRTARKQHKCDECRRTIEPKEKYEYAVGMWDYVQDFKTCDLCLELRRWAQISVPCFCFNHGDMLENVKDMVSEARKDCPPGFVMEWGRRMVKIKRKRYGVHWPMRHEKLIEDERLRKYRAEIAAEREAIIST